MAYVTPETSAEALAILGQGNFRVFAGCTDLYPATEQGEAPDDILDINGVADFSGISETEDGWRVGATTTWTQIANAALPRAFDALKQAAVEIGSIQIQNRATIGGNICNASPAADGIPPLLALDAAVEVVSHAGTRIVPLDRFVTGVRSVDLCPNEIVAAVRIPRMPTAARGSFIKLGSRAHLVISIAMVAVVMRHEAGRVADVRFAVGSCSPVARRLPALEERLKGQMIADVTASDFLDPAAYEPLRPISDIRGDADYRGDAVPELCRRAFLRACGGDGE